MTIGIMLNAVGYVLGKSLSSNLEQTSYRPLGLIRSGSLAGLSRLQRHLRHNHLVLGIRLLCPSYYQRSHPKHSLPVLTTPFTFSEILSTFLLALPGAFCMYQRLGRSV